MIRRKKPLTSHETKGIKRKDAIHLLHAELKSRPSIQETSIPLALYQNASSKGQNPHLGGDSSKILVQWLHDGPVEPMDSMNVLEVGCLEVDNAIGKYVTSRHGQIRHIDLKSRDPRIEEQDFMKLEVPKEVSLPQARLM